MYNLSNRITSFNIVFFLFEDFGTINEESVIFVVRL